MEKIQSESPKFIFVNYTRILYLRIIAVAEIYNYALTSTRENLYSIAIQNEKKNEAK